MSKTRGATTANELDRLQRQIIGCARCPRLVKYREEVARVRRRMYASEVYWGKPLPSFGDPEAELLILGLAPAAHGGNRTGRMFTGDRSGDFLYRALYEAGFANQPESRHREDGLELRNCFITASLRCAPPANKPLPEELRNCSSYLETEFRLLRSLKAVLALGRIAFDSFLRLVYHSEAFRPVRHRDWSSDRQKVKARRRSARPGAGPLPVRSSLRFGHGLSYDLGDGIPRLFCSYHPSQQNTQTGKLTPEMLRRVLDDIRMFLLGTNGRK
ncbi:MAG: uracil-DNA glycosylase [Terriglobia bacterium]